VFISYAREDQKRVAALAALLEEHGWSVFWDRRIPAGQTWRTSIGRGLHDARCVVVAWSRHSSESQWVIEEAEDAKGRGVLVPVLLEDVIPPFGFRSLQAADLSHWNEGTTEATRALVNDIALLVDAAHPRSSTGATPISSGKSRVPLVVGTAAIAALALGFVSWVAIRPQPRTSDLCRQGYVWREAVPGDHVCVRPEMRQQARDDNDQAASRRQLGGGPYGPDTCKQGFKWRGAVPDDHVCVLPEVYDQTQEDNAHAAERRVPERQ
jgi:hypothetical protein